MILLALVALPFVVLALLVFGTACHWFGKFAAWLLSPLWRR